jgi:acetyl esterase
MTSSSDSTALIGPASRSATVLGLVLRAVKLLPRSAQRAVLNRAASGGELPPVADLRRMMEISGGMPNAGPSDEELFAHSPQLRDVVVTEQHVAGPGGKVPARLYRLPQQAPGAALVWVHGGGFLFNDIDSAEAHWVALALAARGTPVLSLSYRQSIGGVHAPASSDDVLAGWLWATEHADELGVSVDQLHLGGASAGGALTAGVTKRLRDGAGPAPASVVLVYPLVHPELPDPDPELLSRVQTAPGVPYFSPKWIADCSLNHVGDRARLDDPYAFAANGDVSGVPPTWILTCELDTLRVSGEAYAEKLRAAGVPVTVELQPGAGHGTLSEPFSAHGQDSLGRISARLHTAASGQAIAT